MKKGGRSLGCLLFSKNASDSRKGGSSILLKPASRRCLQDDARQVHDHKAFEPNLLGKKNSAMATAMVYQATSARHSTQHDHYGIS